MGQRSPETGGIFRWNRKEKSMCITACLSVKKGEELCVCESERDKETRFSVTEKETHI